MARRTPCSRVAEPAAEPSLAEAGVEAPVEAEGETAAVAAVAMAPSGVEAVVLAARSLRVPVGAAQYYRHHSC